MQLRHVLTLPILKGLSVLLFCWLWWHHAWISDDAMITFRTVIHFIQGNGMVWNAGERVQAFTHPSWFMLISAASAITGELFRTSLAVSFLCAGGAYFILLQHVHCRTTWAVATLLLFSQAFVDYTSSGLENPLSYLLMALIFTRYLAHKVDGWLFLLMGIAFLNRMDFAVILLPAALIAWREMGFKISPLLPGLCVALAWLGFALFYFGFPLPNTFLAKLGAAYPAAQYWHHFTDYVRYSLEEDTSTLMLILAGICIPFIWKNRARAIAIGLLLYFAYLAKIGGDFMGGRFFAVPALLASIALIYSVQRHGVNWHALRALLPERLRQRVAIPSLPTSGLKARLHMMTMPASILLIAITSLINTPPLANGAHYFNEHINSGVADERGWYFDRWSLANDTHSWPTITHDDIDEPMILCGGAGHAGLVHFTRYILDTCGLGSPYTARLPAMLYEDWRVGHYTRRVPEPFLEWIKQPETEFEDVELTRYFNDIRQVTTGPLWEESRLNAIWRINMTHYDFDRSYFETPLPLEPSTSPTGW